MKGPRTDNGERQAEEPRLLQRIWTSIGAVNISLALGGALALVVGFISWVFFHEVRTFSYTLMAIGGLLVLVSFLSSYHQVMPVLLGRRSRYGTNTLIMGMAVIGIAMLVNFLSFNNDSRADLTATKQFTLARRTTEILQNLPAEIRATGFFRAIDPAQEETKQIVDDLLHEFSRRSGGKFTYRFIDPDTDPVTTREYGISQYQRIVLENMVDGTRYTVATPPVLEERFVTGLLVVSGQQQKRVYFLVGHGERDSLDVEKDEGYGFAYNGLVHDNYEPLTLNLASYGQVPDDAAAVIIAGPKNEFYEGEELALAQYLLSGGPDPNSGGRVLALLDPDTPPGMRNFFASWGALVVDGQVIDMSSSVGGDPRIPLLQRGQYSDIDPDLTNALDVTFFPQVAPVVPALKEDEDQLPDTMSFSPIAWTSFDSYLTNDPDQTRPSSDDTLGPFYVATTIKATAPRGIEGYPVSTSGIPRAEIVVVGDSDFASNRYFYAFSNGDLFLDAVNWLTGDVSLISIRPKPYVFRELVLTSKERDFFRYSTWFLLPIAMLGLAGIVWWRRR